MAFTIKGAVAFVTGANRGIGRALVEALIEGGAAKVYAGSRDPKGVRDLVAAHGGRVVAVELDVTKEAQVMAAARQAKDVTLLINNAGVATLLGAEFADAAWRSSGRDEMEVNLFGTLGMTQAFAPILAGNGGGALANVISVAAFANFPALLSYSASKAALHSVTQATRTRLKGQGTYVAGIYPGPVDTDMGRELQMEKAAPIEVARAVIADLEAGIEEIFPDAVARQLGPSFLKDPKGTELAVAAMAG